MINATEMNMHQHTFIMLDLVSHIDQYNLKIEESTYTDLDLSKYIDAIFCQCPIPEPIFILENDIKVAIRPNGFLIAVYKYMNNLMTYTSSVDGINSVPYNELPMYLQRRIKEKHVVSYVSSWSSEACDKLLRNIY